MHGIVVRMNQVVCNSRMLRVDGEQRLEQRSRAAERFIDDFPVGDIIKNASDTEYFQYMSVQPGNSGAVFALLGDPRTYGLTLRIRF